MTDASTQGAAGSVEAPHEDTGLWRRTLGAKGPDGQTEKKTAAVAVVDARVGGGPRPPIAKAPSQGQGKADGTALSDGFLCTTDDGVEMQKRPAVRIG